MGIEQGSFGVNRVRRREEFHRKNRSYSHPISSERAEVRIELLHGRVSTILLRTWKYVRFLFLRKFF